MIQEISIENHLSIGECQTISFVATSDKSHLDEVSVEVKPGLRLLRLLFLYGANASGKTNVLLSIQTVWYLLFRPQQEEHVPIPFYNPFALRQGEPTRFLLVFWAMGRKYEYTVAYDEQRILSEKMMYTTPAGVLSKLYERDAQGNITYGSTVGVKVNERHQLKSNTLPNHTVLSTLNKISVDIPLMNELYQWIKQHVHTQDEWEDIYAIATEAQQNESLKKMIVGMLQRADFNIVDFSPLQMELPESLRSEMSARGIDEEMFRRMFGRGQVLFTHQADATTFTIASSMESRGTLMYFRLARMLSDLKTAEAVCVKDEIEDSLNYDLMVHYLKLFLELENHTQLICTTHTRSLLSEDWMVRRDMVWITEKENACAETRLVRVSDMGLHKNISLENAYRIGKLGGLPRLGSTLIRED